MLNGLDALLGTELLTALRSMGHGDELVLVGPQPPSRRVEPAGDLARWHLRDPRARRVLPVMRLDDFVPDAGWRMAVVGDDQPELPIFTKFRKIVATCGTADTPRGARTLRLLRARPPSLRHRCDQREPPLRQPPP